MLFCFHCDSEAANDKIVHTVYKYENFHGNNWSGNMHGQGCLTTLISEGTDDVGLSNQISQSDEQIAAHEKVLPSVRANSST